SKNVSYIRISSAVDDPADNKDQIVYVTIDDFQVVSVGEYLNTDPYEIELDNSSISSSATGAGTPVGVLTTKDVDASDAHTYSLVADGASSSGSCGPEGDDDNANFQIDGASAELQTKGHL